MKEGSLRLELEACILENMLQRSYQCRSDQACAAYLQVSASSARVDKSYAIQHS
jgi:hypothetical protein